jgi:hypothetical protein
MGQSTAFMLGFLRAFRRLENKRQKGQTMDMNYLAILAASVAGWLVGAVWYGVLGKAWMAASGKSEAEIASATTARKMPAGPMILAFIAQVVMTAMFAGLLGHLGYRTAHQGAIAGALLWLGFVITTQAVNNAFQMRKPMLTVIDGGHWLVVLAVQGAILATM